MQLLLHYRSNPAICDPSSEVLYGGSIRTATAAGRIDAWQERHLPLWSPSTFINVAGEEQGDGTSWTNLTEARATVRALEVIVGCISDAPPTDRPSVSVAVITPYRAQLKVIDAELRAMGDFPPTGVTLRTGTIDSFQGSEADVVLISTVRTQTWGFTEHDNRVNVAITRARRLRVVLGKKSLLTGLQGFTDEKGFRLWSKIVAGWRTSEMSWTQADCPLFGSRRADTFTARDHVVSSCQHQRSRR